MARSDDRVRVATNRLAHRACREGATDQVCDLDDLLLNELMDVVTQRFHRSPVKASVCGHILLHIAKNLAYTPKVLAVA